jgi:cob(I)alamin adenosyltransferase
MAVHLTRIYTRTGDAGTTALGDMSRVRKTDPRLVAYADVDEANSAIGVALALGRLDPPVAEVLRSVQNDLFDVGADLCVPVADNPEFPPLRVTDAQVERLERACDEFNEGLRKLDSFLLLIETDPDRTAPVPARYLNRLSDLLFILARVANPDGDVLWAPGANR